jgi:cell division protein FtsL
MQQEWEWARQRERSKKAAAAAKNVPTVSLFAVFGTILAAALMVFVVLAQISYNEVTSETVRLNTQLRSLTEQQRRLEITFESVVDMKMVEQYARDVLGMSPPEADQVAIMMSISLDKAEIVRGVEEESRLRGLGSFLSSLLEYFG